jgi:hypothetical protein
MTTESRPRVTVDEAMEILSDIARNGEGAEKFRALKVIMAQETGSVTVPEPMNDEEKIETLSMLMEAMGPIGCQFAYRRAFPWAKEPVNNAVIKVQAKMLEVDEKKLPKTLKDLYRKFPEIKRNGFPPTYPVNKGIEEKKQWCQKQAMKILLDRKQAEVAPPPNMDDDDAPAEPTES